MQWATCYVVQPVRAQEGDRSKSMAPPHQRQKVIVQERTDADDIKGWDPE